jgi:competence protein ComEC
MLLVYLAVAWTAGIAVASLFSAPIEIWLVWLAFAFGLLLIWWRDKFLRLIHVCLLFLLLGALRQIVALPHFDEHHLAYYNERGVVAITGVVSDPPDVRDTTTHVRVQASRIRVDNQWRILNEGLVLVYVPRETQVQYGDQVQVYGALTTPPEYDDFSYKDYLARQGVHSLIRYARLDVNEHDQGNPFFAALYKFRDSALETIYKILPDPSASLLAGILLGIDSGIPRDVKDAFSATNTAHIIAISGFNISIIAGILLTITRRLMRQLLATLIVILGLIAYTLFVGASASVVRAAVMGILSVLALQYGRQNDALNALAASAFAMTLWNPFTLFDMGFQLSFLATMGLILYVTPLSHAFEKFFARFVAGEHAKQIVGVLNDSFIVTLAAQITTTPLIVFAFHRMSLVGLLTNLIVLPVQPQVMIIGGIATIAAMIFMPLGQIIAWVAWAFLEFTIVVVQWTASLPFAAIPVGRFDVFILTLYYVVLFGVTLTDWRALLKRISLRPALAIGVALVVGMWMWSVALTAPDDKAHIEFIDAGSAATLVRTPSGARILIDGGSNPSTVVSTLGERMPFWERTVDLIVLTNGDDDHVAGLVPVLERYDVKQIIQATPPTKPTAAYLKWRDLIAQKHIPTLTAQPGLIVQLDRDVILEIAYTNDDPKNGYLVAELRTGNFATLFADSATLDDQDNLQSSEADVASTIIVAPSKIVPELVETTNPQFAIWFGTSGTRGKPSADWLSAFVSVTILNTDERGNIEFVTDGQALSVRTTR